jgi:fructose-specific phosphotransferase system component IIB
MSLPANLEKLMDDLAEWRRTEVITQEEVEHAEAIAIAADLKHEDAKRHLAGICAKISDLSRDIRHAINEHTAPSTMLFLTEGDD